MPLSEYFRSMTPAEDGRPRVGRGARTLGIRIPEDVQPGSSGMVLPVAGGMSVAPQTLWNLPHHRRPSTMGRGSTGPDQDRVLVIRGTGIHQVGLTVRPDPALPARHAFVEPPAPMLLSLYEEALARTRPEWECAWP